MGDLLVLKLACLLLAYVKIREIVRKARSENCSKDELVRRLMLSVGLHEACILERISASFYRADETLTKKREKIGWGNVRKVYDRLHKLLAERVAQLELTPKKSKNYWSQTFLRRVLLECFRARAVAHTSDRYNLLLSGKKLRHSVPAAQRAWSLYGSQATKWTNQDPTHCEYASFYQKQLKTNAVDLPTHTITSARPLTVEDSCKIFGTTPFTSYQILGDLAHLSSNTLVSVKEKDLGTGAHLGSVKLNWHKLRKRLNNSGEFRKWFGGRIKLLDLGHLVCELRQNFKKRNLADFETFLREFSLKRCPGSASADLRGRKRKAAVLLANYAVPK